MKRLFALMCSIIYLTNLCIEDGELRKISDIQMSTHPLRLDLRKLKNIIVGYRRTLREEQKEEFKINEECFRWRDGRVTYLLDAVLKELDHVHMNIHNNKFIHIDRYFNNAAEHLNRAKAELSEYKNMVKELIKIDVDKEPDHKTQAKL